MFADDFDRDAAERLAVARLIEKHGREHESRIRSGIDQTLQMWRQEDGDAEAFLAFVDEHFLVEERSIADTFLHLERSMEMLDGHLVSVLREFRHYMDVEVGPVRPLDRLLAAYDPFAHVNEDLFKSKVAFVALLNYEGSTLQERLEFGDDWTRRHWAEVRLTGRFEERVPAEAQQAVTAASARADAYIADYNLYLHHWLTPDGRRLFPEGLRLISHWNLRDELKSNYSEAGGLEKQRMIADVMEKIVRQEIPQVVINNPLVDWTPATGALALSEVQDAEAPPGARSSTSPAREPDTRYRMLLDIFHAMQQVDPWVPKVPTAIARSFDVGREIPVQQVRAMFEELFRAPVAADVARLIEARLGREIEPFDIWYAGFKPRAEYGEAELDAITRERYPTKDAFEADIPRILRDLGFAAEKADMLAAHIVVDPSRGAGHAMGAARRDDAAHLRTRVGPDGMDYKGYNIAIHELGHNVEQVFSLNTIDHTLLQGVPGSAFTEALAFVFQERDLALLGLAKPSEEKNQLLALEAFWGACEIGAVALVDIAVWEWMYAHPDASAEELRQATVRIASDVWKRTFAPLMHDKESLLLGIYSHMLAYPLYLSNYPLGHLIAYQLEEHFRGADLAAEFERVCQLGRLTPDLWMQRAVGARVSAQPLIQAAERAVAALGGRSTAREEE
ncbi:MAG: hypothetical protein JSW67_11060 [Candidatus Latescibacterota bacterium]|nr:MAG: hypothetical protein JSW67_11060 [Candidatus Latescibacterota bacterium]